MTQFQCTGLDKLHSSLPVLLCKTGRQHCSVLAKTPLDISSTHRCAVSHHQWTSALVRAKCIPHRLCCSAKQADNIVESLQRHLWIFLQHTGVQCPNFNALQHCSRQNAFLTGCVALQNRLTAVLCHCKDTFGYFFNTQVCSVPSPMHFSTGQGEMHSSLPVLLCKTGRQHCRVIAKTALDISSTHRCAVSQLQCTAALLKTKCIPHCLCCSAKQADSSLVSLQRHLWIFLQHTGVQCPITNALQHWSGRNAFLTACVALQNRLTAVLCHCKDTFGYSFETQVCSVPSPMHYCTGQGKSHSSLPRVTLQNRLTAGLCHCK